MQSNRACTAGMGSTPGFHKAQPNHDSRVVCAQHGRARCLESRTMPIPVRHSTERVALQRTIACKPEKQGLQRLYCTEYTIYCMYKCLCGCLYGVLHNQAYRNASDVLNAGDGHSRTLSYSIVCTVRSTEHPVSLWHRG